MGEQKTALILIMILCFAVFSSVVLISIPQIGVVQAATDVPSIIDLDTTWTKTNGPYELKGPVLLNNGVTLTIEPGTTVNLNKYYIQVNGTLNARGTTFDLINFNSGKIVFADSSSDWSEQTGSGCIIENSDLSNAEIVISGSPKINNNSIYEISVDGSATISENTVLGGISISGSPMVLHNSITNSTPFSVSVNMGSPIISHNIINCRILVSGGSPTFSDNTVNDGVHVDSRGGSVEIENNNISIRGDYNVVHVQGVPATVSNNIVTGIGNRVGIYVYASDDFFVSGNTVSNCQTGISGQFYGSLTIEGNGITNNHDGIHVTYYKPSYVTQVQDSSVIIRNNFITDNSGKGVIQHHFSATILNNTIANNEVGIAISQTSTILNNNIYSNAYNLKSETEANINATFNWWGTTDISTINQTIYDFKYDFNLGTVNFIPFLTEPNPEIPEFPSRTYLIIMLVVVIVVAVIYRHIIQKQNKQRKNR